MEASKHTGRCPMGYTDGHTESVITYVRAKLKEKYKDDKPMRAVHAKSIGLVHGIMKVEPDLDDFLRVGLFKEKEYHVWIRYSNGNADGKKADVAKTARGMAIKIMERGSLYTGDGIHDIIMTNAKIFVPGIKSLQLAGITVILGKVTDQIVSFFKVLAVQPRGVFSFLRQAPIVCPNVLEEMYYSATPSAFGKGRAVKWHARPLKTITSSVPRNPTDDFLRHRLIKDLSTKSAKEDISFALYVQFQEDSATEPIDNTAVEWKTPFFRVATIHIGKQDDIDSKERIERDEKTWFSPANAHADHAALGGVNAVRSKLYTAMAKERLAHPVVVRSSSMKSK